VTVVLFAEGLFIAALNWFLAVVVDRQDMSLAGLDPGAMATSSKAGAVIFGLYFVLCGLVALLVAVRDRAPSGLGRALLISAAVVHGLLGAFSWGLVGWSAFLLMVAVMALVVLLLMTYDAGSGMSRTRSAGDGTPGGSDGALGTDGAPKAADGPSARSGDPERGTGRPAAGPGAGGAQGAGVARSRNAGAGGPLDGAAVEPSDAAVGRRDYASASAVPGVTAPTPTTP
jgi:hypothetical protein